MIGNPRGMTLTEVLIAIFIITIGLTAVAAGMSVVAGVPVPAGDNV